MDEDGCGWMSKVEGDDGWIDRWRFLGKGFKVSEDRTREPSLFQGSGFLRAWGWLSQYTGPPFI